MYQIRYKFEKMKYFPDNLLVTVVKEYHTEKRGKLFDHDASGKPLIKGKDSTSLCLEKQKAIKKYN